MVYRRIKKDHKIITEQKALLEQSLGEKETLLKEIHHRVKNNLQIISGLFDKQARLTKDELARKLMKDGQDRVFSIALVHQNLYQSDNLTSIEIKSYLEMLVKNIEKSQKSELQDIQLTLDVDDSVVDIDRAIPLGLILNELITNCYKYAFKDREKGDITVRFRQNAAEFVLGVQDNGVGLPTHFDIQKTRSLGLNLVRGLVRQLGGKLDFASNAEGVTFTIHCIQ
jgi:two-component sensor histidine kinase